MFTNIPGPEVMAILFFKQDYCGIKQGFQAMYKQFTIDEQLCGWAYLSVGLGFPATFEELPLHCSAPRLMAGCLAFVSAPKECFLSLALVFQLAISAFGDPSQAFPEVSLLQATSASAAMSLQLRPLRQAKQV